MSSRSSKRWKDPTDYWNIKLFSSLHYRTSSGIPIIRAYKKDIPEQIIPANISAGGKVTPIKSSKRDAFAHFYLDDYHFERFWNFPIRYVKYLQTFDGALSPDFSVYADYPEIIQQMNVYRNRALGAYWQSQGIPVIPSVSWSSLDSLQWCFDAIEPRSVVAISTVGVLRTPELKKHLVIGYLEMVRQLEPIHILVYGKCPEELYSCNIEITQYQPFYQKFE